MNQLYADLFGYNLEEVFAMKPVDFISPSSREFLEKNIYEDYDLPYEVTGLKKDGTTFSVEIHGKTMPYGGKSCRVATIRDITQRKKSATEREHLIQRLQKTLEEINVLHGILPICASCKKIRDDKGYWNQIEAYIRDHSDTRFSHSICPDCAKTLYPDLKFDCPMVTLSIHWSGKMLTRLSFFERTLDRFFFHLYPHHISPSFKKIYQLYIL